MKPDYERIVDALCRIRQGWSGKDRGPDWQDHDAAHRIVVEHGSKQCGTFSVVPKLRDADEITRAILVNWRGQLPAEVPWLEIVKSLQCEIAAYVKAEIEQEILQYTQPLHSDHGLIKARDRILATLQPKQGS